MIIYVENEAFPRKTFVALVNPDDKVARIRAQLLHILYEIGREEHQFRLRYNGQFLRDAFSLEDYSLKSNSVVKMVPMNGHSDYALSDARSVSGSLSMSLDSHQSVQKVPTVKNALYEEISTFDWRETHIHNLKTLMYMHFLAMCLTLTTVYWFAVFWCAVYMFVGLYFIPGYTRLGGYTGNTYHRRFIFCGVYGGLGLAILGVSLYFTSRQWIDIANHGCPGAEFVDDCSSKKVWTAIFYLVQSVLLLITSAICGVLIYSFQIEKGDLIVKYLVQERDIEDVMKAANSGKLKERRTAAYEMATMAASSDDNKFRIVAEGGLDVLISMSLSTDESTQEYAVEALSELITIQSIQDTYVEMGGVTKLTALLHSSNARVMQEASRALYTICQSDENRYALVADHGLTDLSHAARNGTIETQRTIASIFLELVFNSEIRSQLTTRSIPAQALVQLCQSNDPETLKYALMTLELMAIESSDVICAQEDLLEILLDLPRRVVDRKLYVLAGKILLYFAENRQTCELMQNQPNLRECLDIFAKTNDAVLQKVVIKIIFCMMDTKELKLRSRVLKLDRILIYIQDNAADRDAWDMADQGVQVIQSDQDNFPTLPIMSTLEKLKMGQGTKGTFGSRTSLRSDGGGSTGSSSDMKKGLH